MLENGINAEVVWLSATVGDDYMTYVCFREQSLTNQAECLCVLQHDSSLLAPAAARQDSTGI